MDSTEVSRILVEWFDVHGRHLPWRPDEDPYRIWLMVVMLQQTRVETVLPYYERFVMTFPTLPELAAADDEAVLAAWKGLGYYRRARNLLAGAREMAASYNGRVPEAPEALERLPGVGRYTAAAVASIAFDAPAAAVDGNVLRFLSRFFAETGDIGNAKVRARLETLAASLLPASGRGLHNQAAMDFGALVCAPVPHCDTCPFSGACAAFSQGIQADLPKKTGKTAPLTEHHLVARIRDDSGRTLLHRRPATGLLANFWELPNVVQAGDPAAAFLSAGLNLEILAELGEVRHVFTHRLWVLHVVSARLIREPADFSRYQWCADPHEATLPRAFSKILELD
ncbi:A/G-specific adenine glycosylase [Myxococcota bacterium]|nr:A/G-specific adenine glycosylase [Myxococcota bacterium]MBU1413811.1 A/G-specific adenine glycosylase [Myxococcota bacterium]